MEIGNAIVLATCLYIGWEMVKVVIQFYWQITIEERRHKEETAALRQPDEIKFRGRMDQRIEKADGPPMGRG